MSSPIEIIIFDLDGTLASTAELSSGRRVPHDVLKFSPPEFVKSPFLFREELKHEIGFAIQCGIKVIVITRAPQAYASTLLHLLGIDFTECIAASLEFDTCESKIRHISDKYMTPMHQILYLGDLPDDELAAKSVGCHFEYPYWLSKTEIELEENRNKSNFQKIIDEIFEENGEEDEEAGSESKYLNYFRSRLYDRYELLARIAEDEITFDLSSLILIDNETNLPLELQIFNNPVESLVFFQPVINPRFMTRLEYETDFESLQELIDLIQSLFPLTELVPGIFLQSREQFIGKEIRTITKYMNTILGERLWHKCKNWRNKDLGSGPEVHLHILEFVAVVMSSFLTEQAILIPIPSSPFTEKKPGEISRRLAHRICQIRGLNLLDVLSRDLDSKINVKTVNFIENGDYCLIDDQLTNGKTIEECLAALPPEISRDISIMIWSYSSSGNRWVVKE